MYSSRISDMNLELLTVFQATAFSSPFEEHIAKCGPSDKSDQGEDYERTSECHLKECDTTNDSGDAATERQQ
jgi:hypothetical protein